MAQLESPIEPTKEETSQPDKPKKQRVYTSPSGLKGRPKKLKASDIDLSKEKKHHKIRQSMQANAVALGQAVDIKRAVQLRLKGMTYPDIAKIMGVTKQAIHKALLPLSAILNKTESLPAYQANKADIIDNLQAEMARQLVDPAKIQKATLGNVAYAMRQLNDIGRLERDLSTSNVAYADLSKTIDEIDNEISTIQGTTIPTQSPETILDNEITLLESQLPPDKPA